MAPSGQTPDTRIVSGVLIGLLALGVALLVANVPRSPLRSSNLQLFAVLVLPLAISLVAYVRFAGAVVWWEIVFLAGWGAVSISLATFVGFLATMGTPGGYPGARVELLRNVAMFLAGTLGLGVPYGLAGRFRHEHPRRAAVSALFASVGVFVLFNAVVVAM